MGFWSHIHIYNNNNRRMWLPSWRPASGEQTVCLNLSVLASSVYEFKWYMWWYIAVTCCDIFPCQHGQILRDCLACYDRFANMLVTAVHLQGFWDTSLFFMTLGTWRFELSSGSGWDLLTGVGAAALKENETRQEMFQTVSLPWFQCFCLIQIQQREQTIVAFVLFLHVL